MSEIGQLQAKEKAATFFAEVEKAELGSVFFVMSSNVGRAMESGDIIENELRVLADSNPTIQIIDINNLKDVEAASGDMSKKYIITNIQPSGHMGFKLGPQMQEAYADLGSDIEVYH